MEINPPTFSQIKLPNVIAVQPFLLQDIASAGAYETIGSQF